MELVGERVLRRAMRLLTIREQPTQSDLIFVLAGRHSRKEYGLKLFHERWAPRLLLSTARFDIRNFAELDLPSSTDIAAVCTTVPPKQRYFFVAVDRRGWAVEQFRKRYWGTLSEIAALAKWLERHREISSILVVSSGFHMARVRMCCEAMLPSLVCRKYVAVPEDVLADSGRTEDRLRKFVAAEFFKIPLYALLLLLRKKQLECS